MRKVRRQITANGYSPYATGSTGVGADFVRDWLIGHAGCPGGTNGPLSLRERVGVRALLSPAPKFSGNP